MIESLRNMVGNVVLDGHNRQTALQMLEKLHLNCCNRLRHVHHLFVEKGMVLSKQNCVGSANRQIHLEGLVEKTHLLSVLQILQPKVGNFNSSSPLSL